MKILNISIISMEGMLSLTSVDFSYKNLSGLVPGNGQFSHFNAISFVGNPELCGSYLGPSNDISASKEALIKGPFFSTFKLLLVIGLRICSMAFAIAVVIKVRALKMANTSWQWKLSAFQRLNFSCDDVLESLKEDNIIGKGGAGIVYKGVMPSGVEVAVKNGGHLHWDTRYKIALEAAKGIFYLHHDCSLIFHRDVKSNNILLDSNFEDHVADFALPSFCRILVLQNACLR